MTDESRVYIAHTGGTIGMRRSGSGWDPSRGFLEEQMRALPVFDTEGMPAFTIEELDPLLDSANMAPADWVRIALAIERNYDEYDGFVVLHGTDTMAYTASALAFMLENLAKPVILTGSQVPLCEARNDAQDNLVTSLLLACHGIPEVGLYFGRHLFRGCRVTKIHSRGFDAFASPNEAPLASVGADMEIDWSLVRPAPEGTSLRVHHALETSFGVLWLFPGITGEIVRNFLAPPLKGVVLLAFGVGNGPAHSEDFISALREAHDRGVVIVDCTQCLAGRVQLDEYATGAAMAATGAVSGFDMTPEAALTKLFYLFGKGLTPDEVELSLPDNLRGELSPH